jgi:hypothetical protein
MGLFFQRNILGSLAGLSWERVGNTDHSTRSGAFTLVGNVKTAILNMHDALTVTVDGSYFTNR